MVRTRRNKNVNERDDALEINVDSALKRDLQSIPTRAENGEPSHSSSSPSTHERTPATSEQARVTECSEVASSEGRRPCKRKGPHSDSSASDDENFSKCQLPKRKFTVRTFAESEKLTGKNKWRIWKKMILMELKMNNLHYFQETN